MRKSRTFLTGGSRPDPVIVNIGHKRKLDLAVEVPPMPLGPIASNEMWDEIYNRLVTLVEQHRSTLVFVNTRRMAERIAHQLGERMGEENVAAHHGSLSRKLRLAAEKKLKEGQVRVLVATASLELGIDVGTVDLVVQINSCRADCGGAAARGAVGTLARRGSQRTILRHHARRSVGVRGSGAGDPAWAIWIG